MSIRSHLLASICFTFCVSAPTAAADQVDLANGDRLTGTVVRKDGDQLVLKTSYAGEIKIAWTDVARVQTDQPMSLVLSDQSLAQAHTIGTPSRATTQPSTTGESTEQDKTRAEEAPPVIPADNVAYINAGPGVDLLGVRWKGRINVGGSGNRGNSDTDNLHIDGEAVARLQRERYTLNGVLDRGKDRGLVTKQASRVSGKYDRFIQPTWYGYALASVEEDRFRDIDRRTTLGAGLGHQLYEDERTNLSIEGGLNHVRTDYSLAPDESYPALRWALKFDHKLQSSELQVFHSHEVLSDLQRAERTFVRSQTGLRIPLLQSLLATAQLNIDYDNAPAPGKVKSDRTYLFTVGYRW